nr:hypothetical protein [Tanacetum cinerariifolium]
MAFNFNNENDPWEYSLDIDYSNLHLTMVLRSSNSARVEPTPYTPNPVTIIPGLGGIIQLSSSTCVEPSSSTSNPVRIILDPKVVEDVGEDDDFNSGAWFSATNYVIATGGTITGYLSRTISRTVHHKVIGDGGYGKDIILGAAMILVNVFVFTPKPSKNYLNITKRNVVKVFFEKHDTCDEYLTEGFPTEKEQQQLAQDEEAYKDYLEEEAKAKKERARAEKEWEE